MHGVHKIYEISSTKSASNKTNWTTGHKLFSSEMNSTLLDQSLQNTVHFTLELLNTNQLVKSSVTLKCTVMEAKDNMLFTQKMLPLN